MDNSAGYADVDCQVIDPATLVMSNSLLLNKIFENLTLRDLKNCRRINELWKSVARTKFLEESQINFSPRSMYAGFVYVEENSPDLGHQNYKLLICDLDEDYTPSLPLFQIICTSYGTNIKNLVLDLDITNNMAFLVKALSNVEPLPNLETLTILLRFVGGREIANHNNVEDETVQAAALMLRIFSSVKFLYFHSYITNFRCAHFQNEFLEKGILSELKNLQGGRFTEEDIAPYSYDSIQILTQLPHPRILTKVDFGQLFPGCGPALEAFLERFANSLEEFFGMIESSERDLASIVRVPVMTKLTKLLLSHRPGQFMEFDYTTDTEVAIKLGFYPNFVTQLPLIKELEVGTDAIVEDQENFNKDEDLISCFFGLYNSATWRQLKCTTARKVNIVRNFYSGSSASRMEDDYGFYRKMRAIFPNATIRIRGD